eukprot:TRINITY_DN1430_c0_g1_i1.p1 TRINITY_DN1430_c0_g1~~TRINITY_DN1430_c0_g1_i1.p1  ORF type:complete len:519 (-),score=170.23 TRINITY_DN1430_c0_g1_i1:138-1652(-)
MSILASFAAGMSSGAPLPSTVLALAGLALTVPCVAWVWAADAAPTAHVAVVPRTAAGGLARVPPLATARPAAATGSTVAAEAAGVSHRDALPRAASLPGTRRGRRPAPSSGPSAVALYNKLAATPSPLRPLHSVATSVAAAAAASGERVGERRHDFALIVSNKGGGHGEIAFHLALALRAKGLQVQLINDNGGKDVTSKPPFSQYGQLTAAGVEISFVDLSKPGALDATTCPPGHLCRAYDYIFDNQNVCQRDVANLATQCGAFYVYVSSGGMYIPGDRFPMKESTPSKGADSNEQRKHELYVMSKEVRPLLRGCAFFRPQYIVGPYTNKRDYLDWFFDRLTRNIPIPLPAPGTQTTTITDARDVAGMLASVVGRKDAILEAEQAHPDVGPVFNCASDRPVTLLQIAHSCGAACGKTREEVDALIRLYDPKLLKEAPAGGKFPFRATNFDVGVEKAKVVLDWEPEFSDFDIVAAGYYAGYVAQGLNLMNPKMDLAFDQYILARL